MKPDFGSTETTTEEVGDLGDRAVLHRIVEVVAPTPISIDLIVQDGASIFMVTSTPEDEDQQRGIVLVQYIVETWPGTDEVQFSADGTSTGGFYDRLPAEDSDLLEGVGSPVDVD